MKNQESLRYRLPQKTSIGKVFTNMNYNIHISVLLVLGRTLLHFKACCAPPEQLQILTDESGWGLDSGSLWQKCENKFFQIFHLEALPFGQICLQRAFQGPPSGCRLWIGPELRAQQLFLDYFLSNKAELCAQINVGTSTAVSWASHVSCIILCRSALDVFCQHQAIFIFDLVLSLWKYKSMYLIPARKPGWNSDLSKLYLSWNQSLYLGVCS